MSLWHKDYLRLIIFKKLQTQKKQLDSILNTASSALSFTAGISLAVASVSVMTAMLVSVGERKREIGIKKSKEKAEEALKPKVTWTQYLLNITKSNYTIYFSVFFVICSFLAIGSQYFMYSDSGIGKQFK